MNFLKQLFLTLSVMGVISSQAYAHTGMHTMDAINGLIHFISSPIHTGVIIAAGFVLVVLKIFKHVNFR